MHDFLLADIIICFAIYGACPSTMLSVLAAAWFGSDCQLHEGGNRWSLLWKFLYSLYHHTGKLTLNKSHEKYKIIQ